MNHKESERGTNEAVSADMQKEIVQMSRIERSINSNPLNFEATRWAHMVPILRPIQKAILLVLARHADKYGCSWCSQKTLAAEAGCCDRSVRSVLQIFEQRNLIRRIGRMGSNGGQLTDVVALTDWPGRILIPDTGHPMLGRYVKETLQTKQQWSQIRAQSRTMLPPDAARVSDQNKCIQTNTTTVQYDKLLEQCFEALGCWATAENMRYLVDDIPTLLKWLNLGLDLRRHILPVLAEKAKNEEKIPLIRTWKYFEKAVCKVATKRGSPVRKEADQNSPEGQKIRVGVLSEAPMDDQEGST